MAPVSLATVLRTAVKLSQPQAQALKIEVRAEVEADLPLVLGDSNQLLQVCVETINNVLHAAREAGSRALSIAVKYQHGLVGVDICDTGDTVDGGIKDEALGNAPSQSDSGKHLSGLGLSACQGILRQHGGRILWSQDQNAGIALRIELPAIPAVPEKAPEKSMAAGVPVMWESQPFA